MFFSFFLLFVFLGLRGFKARDQECGIAKQLLFRIDEDNPGHVALVLDGG